MPCLQPRRSRAALGSVRAGLRRPQPGDDGGTTVTQPHARPATAPGSSEHDASRYHCLVIRSFGARVPPRRINEIVLGKRAVTADTALRLARSCGTSARFWINLQTACDLDVERRPLARVPRARVEVLRTAS
jgi:hypothetical protein